jgi:hypothetical protein
MNNQTDHGRVQFKMSGKALRAPPTFIALREGMSAYDAVDGSITGT